MPERLAIPGFLRGSRWIAQSGKPSYFVCYETENLKTTTTGPYLDRLKHPTPWSRKMMPLHRDMVRSLCRVRATHGHGIGQALATIRFSPEGPLPRLGKWPGREGIVGAHLLQSLPPDGIPRTAEQKLRGGDAIADWVLLVCGYDAKAVSAAARSLALGKVELYRLAYSLTLR